MDFIFMLTRQDRTVEDCLALAEEIRPLGLRHVGFKDVGVEPAILAQLTQQLKADGATVYLEVVSTTAEACLASARNAVALGIDCLLGGTDVEAIMEIVAPSGMAYYPFPGHPHGHPTRLDGTPDLVAAHCADFVAQGCAGADLLAYRATEADPLALITAARQGLGANGRLIVAGNVDSAARIRDIAAAGADAFTVGTAAFNGGYAPTMGSLLSQLRAIEADCRAVTRGTPQRAGGRR